MSLSLYNKKRDFKETSEPEGKEKSSKGVLRFVIQKHDASSLHYDFRLEMEGVLKSWAVPKGPSLNPADKRLAMMVEDHPYDYRNFEGIIPEGNYGGGTVIVWDEGTYEPMEVKGLSRAEQEKHLLRQLNSGDLKITMHGKKIKGSYALFRLKKGGENSWLLVKKNDEFSSEVDITKENKSIRTGKTIAQVAAENGTVPKHPEAEEQPIKKGAKKTTAGKKAAVKKSAPPPVSKVADKKKVPGLSKLLGESGSLAKRARMPQEIKPMLATLVDDAFDKEDWLFEIKWDGYRAVAYVNNGQCEILSRKNLPFTGKYYPVAEALKAAGINAVFDGEIVAVNEEGLAEFQLLQNWQTTELGSLRYYIFDIVWLDGYDLTRLPLLERKNILQKVLPANHDIIKYSDHVVGKGKEFFEVAVKGGLEGIMAKKGDSPYLLGSRAEAWLKIKASKRQEVIIAGFTQPRNNRKFFGALLLGVYQNKELIYVGHTGSGFNAKSLEAIYKKLQPLVTKESPFAKKAKTNMPATWVKPELVCEIKFTEWTNELQARHAIFMGLREDKNPKDVTIENSAVMKNIVKEEKAAKKGKEKVEVETKVKTKEKVGVKKERPKAAKAAATAGRKKKGDGDLFDVANGVDQQMVISGHELKFTNLTKIYWKKEGTTKGDMLNYYARIAPYILPYMKDRPQSLHRHPNGINGPSFFQKDMKGKLPDWVPTHDDFSESTGETVQYMVCNDEATLLYMANLGCIEMHPWHSRTQSPDNPDYCLIDLDPDDTNTYDEVIETAHVIKKLLDDLKVPGYCKTSGSTGLHIQIPLGAQYDYDQSKQLAELIVNFVNAELPDLTSVERSPAKRKGKIYLDFLQNRQTQTVAAPYSLRPKPGVPVSTPVDWSEVKKGLTATTFNITNIFDRLQSVGDIFKGVMGKGINLEKVLKKMETLIS